MDSGEAPERLSLWISVELWPQPKDCAGLFRLLELRDRIPMRTASRPERSQLSTECAESQASRKASSPYSRGNGRFEEARPTASVRLARNTRNRGHDFLRELIGVFVDIELDLLLTPAKSSPRLGGVRIVSS
jgi:hypothetical protein